jgi:deazaflavin-dependent oxidoreductase (nitroreductase family)
MSTNFESSLRPFFKNVLNPFMLLMWRLGLGPLLNISPKYGGRIMVLTHVGRKSGQLRRTPVNYTIFNGELFCLAGFGSISDWYRNMLKNPNVEVWLPDGWWRGVAEEVGGDVPSRLSLVRQLMIDSGFAAHVFGGIDPHKISHEELEQISKPYRLIHIKREEARTGREGPGELSWVWVVATCALLFMLWRRKK